MNLYETKLVYEVIEHGDEYVEPVEQKQIILCPECLGDKVALVSEEYGSAVYQCRDCSCEFQADEITVTTPLYDKLAALFGYGSVVLFVIGITLSIIDVVMDEINLVKFFLPCFVIAFIFALIYSLNFNDKYDY